MADKSNTNNTSIRFFPFAGGAFAIFAFFWPVEYGTWLGIIVKSFRAASGI